MTATPASRKLPEGWRPAGAGRAIHDETGTEVQKTMSDWSVTAPQRPGRQCPHRNVSALIDFFPTRAAAIEAATERVIPRTRALIADCWDRARAADRARTRLAVARTRAADAEAAYAAALAAGHPGGGWAAVGQAANIAVSRAKLALAMAFGDDPAGWVRFVMVEVTYDEGGTWDIISWGRDSTEPSETASAHALRYALASGLGPDKDRPTVARAWRVRVWSDPAVGGGPDGEWTNLTDPCDPGQHAAGDHPIASGVSRADGSTVESVSCARCLHRVWRVAPYRVGDAPNPNPWVLEGEPLPDPDPAVIYLPIECVRTEHYGMEINDGFGTWYTLIGVGPIDRETGRVEVHLPGRTGSLYATTMVQLRPAPPAVEGPGPDGPGPDDAQTQTRTLDGQPTLVGSGAAAAGPSPVSFGYRVQTRTGSRWGTVRTGNTPRLWRADRTALDAVAHAVLGNAGPVLGLGPSDPVPPVRVRTWHRETGLTGFATHDA